MTIINYYKTDFEKFLETIKTKTKENAIKALETLDQSMCGEIDKERFRNKGYRQRTLLTEIGLLHFKRHIFYDRHERKHVFLLDAFLQLPKNSRLSATIKVKIFKLASVMSYSKVGKNLSDEYAVSKSTVYRTIKNTTILENFKDNISTLHGKIHLQLDEKFIGFVKSTNKQRYYTATIFTGEKFVNGRKILVDKTILSTKSLKKLANKINYQLSKRYKVKQEDEIFISGDFANYIQKFGNRIDVCKTKYVPDKFHVFKAIKDCLGLARLNKYDLNPQLMEALSKVECSTDDNVSKLNNLYKKNKKCFDAYFDIQYLGCSQEGMNSHYYAPRFGKYANRFNPETVEKLSTIIEAEENGSEIKISQKEIYPDLVDLDIGRIYIERAKYVLDTSEMSYVTYKMFNKIKYGW